MFEVQSEFCVQQLVCAVLVDSAGVSDFVVDLVWFQDDSSLSLFYFLWKCGQTDVNLGSEVALSCVALTVKWSGSHIWNKVGIP